MLLKLLKFWALGALLITSILGFMTLLAWIIVTFPAAAAILAFAVLSAVIGSTLYICFGRV
jgi:hypothetical protein